MLIYNNLLINGNSDRFQPFLLNIVSGRRRLLTPDEVRVIQQMKDASSYNEEMTQLFEKLLQEKQFFTDEMRRKIEDSLEVSGYWKKRNPYADDYRFSVEITRSCNMSCPFCYASQREKVQTMTKGHIDAIYAFYQKYADDPKKIPETPYIRITGGEPLVSKDSAMLIPYIAEKWPNAKLLLFTNGLNLLKYFDFLPLDHLGEVHVSLDGLPRVHLKRRFSGAAPDETVYEDILAGIRKLLDHRIDVKIKTTVDRNSYLHMGEFRQHLKELGILDSLHCEHLVGITIDYADDLDIMKDSNNQEDIRKIEAYLTTLGVSFSSYPNMTILRQMLSRTENGPYYPKCRRCKCEKLANYFFSCNGNIYFCDCVKDDIGKLGTYYPEAKLDEEAVSLLYNRTVFNHTQCANCAYKFICLGGCRLSAVAKEKEMVCSVFAHEDILDNLEFDYNALLYQRMAGEHL